MAQSGKWEPVSLTALRGVQVSIRPDTQTESCEPVRFAEAATRSKRTEGRAMCSVLPRVFGRASVQVDLEGLFLARGVADAVSSFEQTAALFLHQLITLVL